MNPWPRVRFLRCCQPFLPNVTLDLFPSESSLFQHEKQGIHSQSVCFTLATLTVPDQCPGPWGTLCRPNRWTRCWAVVGIRARTAHIPLAIWGPVGLSPLPGVGPGNVRGLQGGVLGRTELPAAEDTLPSCPFACRAWLALGLARIGSQLETSFAICGVSRRRTSRPPGWGRAALLTHHWSPTQSKELGPPTAQRADLLFSRLRGTREEGSK